MHALLAMAGIAEAGEYYAILIFRGVIALAIALSLWGLFRRSRIIAWIGLAVIAVALAAEQPWRVFMLHPSSDDPDVFFWLKQWRLLSTILVGGFVFCAAALVGTIVRKPKTKDDVKSTAAQRT